MVSFWKVYWLGLVCKILEVSSLLFVAKLLLDMFKIIRSSHCKSLHIRYFKGYKLLSQSCAGCISHCLQIRFTNLMESCGSDQTMANKHCARWWKDLDKRKKKSFYLGNCDIGKTCGPPVHTAHNNLVPRLISLTSSLRTR